MGEENGVIAKIQQHRKAQWEELFPNIPYEELIIKGCTDHIMATSSSRAKVTLPSPFYFTTGTVRGHLECMWSFTVYGNSHQSTPPV